MNEFDVDSFFTEHDLYAGDKYYFNNIEEFAKAVIAIEPTKVVMNPKQLQTLQSDPKFDDVFDACHNLDILKLGYQGMCYGVKVYLDSGAVKLPNELIMSILFR